MNNGKPFLVLMFFMLLIALFAGGAMSGTDLTPNTPPEQLVNGVNGSVPYTGVLGVSTGTCSPVYTVQRGDTLSKIARNCGVTLQHLLSYNPNIYNPNLIHPGQQIKMVYLVTVTPSPIPPAQPTATPGDPAISGLRPGGKVMIAMQGFPSKVPVVVTLGPVGGEVRSRTEVLTNALGKLNLRMDIPVTANPGEAWVVTVTTVNPPNTTVTAPSFTIEK